MNSRYSSAGFTFVELMLFLAISAIMVVTLLTGWSVAINSQSYKDTARSLAATLQGEYANALNVVNTRNARYSCSVSGGVTVVQQANPGASRGASNCVVMGRYITIDSTEMRSNAIVGTEPANGLPSGATEKDAILAYAPGRVSGAILDDSVYDIPWISKTYISSGNTSDFHAAIAIIRSPATGTVFTYVKDITGGDPSVTEVINAANAQAKKIICMDPGTVVAQPRTAIAIAANAASSSAVSVNANPSETGC